MNAWVLAKDLPALAESAHEPEVRAAARVVLDAYLYPVDSQVLSPSGELLDHVCANDHPGVERYQELLDAALPRDGGR